MAPLPLAKVLSVALPSLAAEARAVVEVLAPVDEIALTPDQGVVYASLRTAGQVVLADAHSLEPIGALEVGGLPRHIAFDKLGSLAIIGNEAGWVDVVR